MTYRLHIIDDHDDHFHYDFPARRAAEAAMAQWSTADIRDCWIEAIGG